MKKYLITGFVVVCLCVAISTVFAKKQSYKSAQWEYGMYSVSVTIIDSEKQSQKGLSTYEWMTSGSWLASKSGRDVWNKAGFKLGDKTVTQVEWFDFLGSQGWELISVDMTNDLDDITNTTKDTYWFKRPKK